MAERPVIGNRPWDLTFIKTSERKVIEMLTTSFDEHAQFEIKGMSLDVVSGAGMNHGCANFYDPYPGTNETCAYGTTSFVAVNEACYRVSSTVEANQACSQSASVASANVYCVGNPGLATVNAICS